MLRYEVIQSYIDLFVNPRYLEVGVWKGDTLHRLHHARKVAVDPGFQIPNGEMKEDTVYVEATSDEYFHKNRGSQDIFEVIYLDGLHTFEQTLRDLLNSLELLVRNGIIIVDDILPNSYHASLPDVKEAVAVRESAGGGDLSWMGDVYRLAFFIQSFLPNFDYATVCDNHGQLIVWRGVRRETLFVKRRVEDIARMEFRHLVAEKQHLNLMPNIEIIKRIKQQRTEDSVARPDQIRNPRASR